MKHKKKVIVIIVASIVAFTGSVFAYNRYHSSPEEHAQHIIKKVSKKLDLDDAQVSMLNIAKDSILQAHKSMHESRSDIHKDIGDILSEDTLDRTAILNHINNKADAVKAEAPSVVNALADFYDSLNVEQQAKIRHKIERHIKHKREHHHDLD